MSSGLRHGATARSSFLSAATDASGTIGSGGLDAAHSSGSSGAALPYVAPSCAPPPYAAPRRRVAAASGFMGIRMDMPSVQRGGEDAGGGIPMGAPAVDPGLPLGVRPGVGEEHFRGDAGGGVRATANSSQEGHTEQMAVDGSKTTYWASKYDEPKPVELEVMLPQRKRISGVMIDWEYPASDFYVQVRDGDKEEWRAFHAEKANHLMESYVYGRSAVVDAIKLVMNAPNAKWGTLDGHGVYGIRGVDVL